MLPYAVVSDRPSPEYPCLRSAKVVAERFSHVASLMRHAPGYHERHPWRSRPADASGRGDVLSHKIQGPRHDTREMLLVARNPSPPTRKSLYVTSMPNNVACLHRGDGPPHRLCAISRPRTRHDLQSVLLHNRQGETSSFSLCRQGIPNGVTPRYRPAP